MAQAADDPRVALYERYQAVPQHQRAEIVNGTLYVMPRPAPPHANAASVLGDLAAKIDAYVAWYLQTDRPFRWSYRPKSWSS